MPERCRCRSVECSCWCCIFCGTNQLGERPEAPCRFAAPTRIQWRSNHVHQLGRCSIDTWSHPSRDGFRVVSQAPWQDGSQFSSHILREYWRGYSPKASCMPYCPLTMTRACLVVERRSAHGALLPGRRC
nr:hypothetical protein CFP56_09056 [Quercus suber]